MKYDYLIVGAGFSGAVVAERLAESGKSVLVIDKREHIGGNAYDENDGIGVLVHKYGPHIFHTNSGRIFEYLSRFTRWRNYEHRVLAEVEGKLLPIPINLTTINELYGLDLDEESMAGFWDKTRIVKPVIRTSEDVVLSRVGKDLCEKFFRGYTKKQWGKDLSELSASVAARIPVRSNRDDRYFTDKYQAMPADGYTSLFENLLDNQGITVSLGVDFGSLRNKDLAKYIVYTGSIDAYFDWCYGELPYRSLRFEHIQFADFAKYQVTATINYPNEHEYTRITEFKYLTGQKHRGTSIVKEYPTSIGDPYYPIPNSTNHDMYKQYSLLADKEKNVIFIGRLAQYKYYNMDQVVAAALLAAGKLLTP